MQKNEEVCVACGCTIPEGRQVCHICMMRKDCKYFRNEKACFVLKELVCKQRKCSFFKGKDTGVEV